MQQTTFGPGRDNRASDLIAKLKDAEPDVRRKAAWELRSFDRELDVVLPALVSTLADEDVHVRFAALTSLADIGPDAKRAVPAIIKRMFEDHEAFMRMSAQAVLELIEGTRVDWTRDPLNPKQIELWLEQLPAHARPKALAWWQFVSDTKRNSQFR